VFVFQSSHVLLFQVGNMILAPDCLPPAPNRFFFKYNQIWHYSNWCRRNFHGGHFYPSI